MSLLIAAFVVAATVGFFATHWVRGWASEAGLVDAPDGVRRLHPSPVPRLGGVGIFVAVAGVGLVLAVRGFYFEHTISAEAMPLLAALAGAAAIFTLGLWDDVSGLSPGVKFGVEVAVALAVFAAGVRIQGFGLPGGGYYEFSFAADLLITVVWLVGITNAFNLVDGSDGVAGGAAIFASATVALVSVLNGNDFAALFALTLAGATLGFLFFNFPPASIFLGDCGSLFLGFMLGALGILSAQKATTAVAVAIPVVSFGLPILDTLLAMGRRLLRGEPVFNGDRGHIHHRLRDLGHSPRTVALLLYAVCGGFALLSLILVQHPTQSSVTAVLVVLGAVVWLSIQRLHIPELLEVGRIVGRGLRQRSVIANNVRIREAVGALDAAETVDEGLEAVTYALGTKEFERAEIWLSGEMEAPVGESAVLEPRGGGYLCRLSFDQPPPDVDHRWEVRFQICDPSGAAIGYLALWPGRERDHLLIDLRLLADQLLPAFEGMLVRIGGGGEEPASAASEVETGDVGDVGDVGGRAPHGTRIVGPAEVVSGG